MYFSTFYSVFAIAAAFSQAVSVPESYVVHEKRDSLPSKWMKRDRLDARAVLPVRIGLKQRNLDKGTDLLMDISDPNSANFGKHYTAEQVAELFQPSDDTVAAVKGGGGWITFNATTVEVEQLLRTEVYRYEHTLTGKTSVGSEQYHVPEKIQEHVDFITPGIMISVPMKRSRKLSPKKLKRNPAVHLHNGHTYAEGTTSGATSGCDAEVTPSCITGIYNISQAKLADASNAMGIFETGDIYDQADLDQFFASHATQIPAGTSPKGLMIDGAVAPVGQGSGGGESSLDFELSYPLLYPQGLVLFQTDDSYWTSEFNYSSGFFNTFLDAIDGSYCTYDSHGEKGDSKIDPQYPDPKGYNHPLECGTHKPTNVISISYSFAEADPPQSYQERQCEEFKKLGLMGTTVVVASGDSGVAQRQGDGSENGCIGSDHTVFSPGFPVTCPFVTSVGATTILPGNTITDPESAVTSFGSGGGFSNYYPAPHYQAAAIKEYFKSHDPKYKYYCEGQDIGQGGGIYNRDGRGVPDVAALGDKIVVVVEGQDAQSGGTSASAPIFASVINRINEERIAVGKKAVGFVNPALYKNPSMFNDITLGNNPGCNTKGFSAVTGWDPVTGLGTPRYNDMLKYFLSLP